MEIGPRRVWVAGWQFECCGDPFAIGSTVRWTVGTPGPPELAWLSAVLGDEARRIEAVEEHHGDERGEMHSVEGTVQSIDAVFCRFEPQGQSDGAWGPVDGSGTAVALSSVPRAERDAGDRKFVGYVVVLDVATVAPPNTET